MIKSMTFGASKPFTVQAEDNFSDVTAEVYIFDRGYITFQDAHGNRAHTIKKFRNEEHYKKFFLGDVSR